MKYSNKIGIPKCNINCIIYDNKNVNNIDSNIFLAKIPKKIRNIRSV